MIVEVFAAGLYHEAMKVPSSTDSWDMVALYDWAPIELVETTTDDQWIIKCGATGEFHSVSNDEFNRIYKIVA